jgi:hypothetical protein
VRLRDIIAGAIVTVATALFLLIGVLAVLNGGPVPRSQRAFVPEYRCVSNEAVGDMCERNRP